MSKRFVLNADGRPQAWDLMRAESARPKPAAQLSGWLRERIDEAAGGLVVKDPRTTWFLPLWQQVVAELGERLVFITTLRPPAEAVASAQQWYDRNARRTAATRLAGWLNVMLHTEWETRGSARAFASYHALLSDWRGELRDIDQRLTLDLTLDDSAACAAVDAEIDPDLRRVRVGLEDLPLPAALRDLAADAWSALERLRVAESPGLHAEFDQMREAYDTLYLEAEGIAQSSADAQAAAARRKAARQAKARAESPADGASPDESPAAEDDGDRSPDPA
jgi:hypothetical protein